MRKKSTKPALRVVVPTPADATAPPPILGDAGMNLWRSIMNEYRVDDAAGRQILLQICHAADIADDAHERGLIKEELASRAFITRGLHRMNFDVEPPRAGPGRPSGSNNPTRA